jgi:glycosyltransferase involved in cell wall biosynthesis
MSSTAPSAPVAVVIPCYKQAHFLGEAIESALRQTCPPSEVVVIDDGSPDDVAGVTARYPSVRYIRQRNQGLSAARNTGIRATTSEFLVFLDSDDRLLPHAIERGVGHLTSRPDCAFAAGRMQTIAGDGSILRPWKPLPEADDYFEQMLINHCSIYPVTVMYRRSAIEAVGGGFDTSLRSAEDWDIDFRLARRFPFHLYNEPIAEYRKHGNNMTGNASVMMMSIVRVLQAQRAHIRGHARYEAAYRLGIQRTRKYFSEIIVDQVHNHVRAREWRPALRKTWILLRWHPGIVVERASLKLEHLRNGGKHERVEQPEMATATPTAPPPPPAPARPNVGARSGMRTHGSVSSERAEPGLRG